MGMGILLEVGRDTLSSILYMFSYFVGDGLCGLDAKAPVEAFISCGASNHREILEHNSSDLVNGSTHDIFIYNLKALLELSSVREQKHKSILSPSAVRAPLSF